MARNENTKFNTSLENAVEITLQLDESKIIRKVTNDNFGELVSKTWKDYLDPYTPEDSGLLMGKIGANAKILPWKIWYAVDYAEAVYYETRPVTYKKQTATSQWDKKAAQAGQLNNLYRTLNNALQSGRF